MRFRSVSPRAIRPVTIVVIPPITPMISKLSSGSIGAVLINKIAPAATKVAECSKAETGVGPAMARCSQSCIGVCADLPMAAINNKIPTSMEVGPSRVCAILLLPVFAMRINIAI